MNIRADHDRDDDRDPGGDEDGADGRCCERAAHERGTQRASAWCTRAEAARRVRRECPMLWQLSFVRDGPGESIQRGLLGDRTAQRCLRTPHRWAIAHESHLRRGHTFVANGRERTVKTCRAFDAQLPTFCQASAARSTMSLLGGARRRRGSRARRGLERRSRPLPPAAAHRRTLEH